MITKKKTKNTKKVFSFRKRTPSVFYMYSKKNREVVVSIKMVV